MSLEPKIQPIITSPKFLNEGNNKNVEEETMAMDALNQNTKPNRGSILTLSNLQLNEIINPVSNSNLGNKLLLTGELFWNKELIMEKTGMQNGLRKKADGQAFFGLINNVDYTGTYHNDLVINYPLIQKSSGTTGRVFDISYQKKTNDFQLYMIHNSLCLYYEIENFLYFDEDRDYYIMLGKVFVTISTRIKDNK